MTNTNRRNILKLALTAAALPALPGLLRAAPGTPEFSPQPNDWRSFELRTQVRLAPQGATQIWLPVPSVETDYQRTLDHAFTGNATEAALVTDPATGAQMLHARFDPSVSEPVVELVSRFQTRNRTVDWNRTSDVQEDPAVLEAALNGSSLKPLDGVVLERAREITQGAGTDREKVAAIYAWIVNHCYRNMDVPGCGPGDIQATLTTAGLGGKCADLNGLFVGLARASGVPARDIYGVRVAPSAFGYKQLGANSPDVTGAQHCRAEVWLSGLGWVAMDPADVLKVMRAETDNWIKDPAHPLVAPVNAALFGNWEGNWVAYNAASDVTLPGAPADAALPFLMYPQGLNAKGRLNELDAKAFTYEMTAQEI
ncbi:transglutaminase domain-containing protein (plasmid) [Paracoccus methylovorus]|uniref:Transglutaminase domain-containing protein n=1 Tax=Paracoccus methylovorus TaxID=2812658 RepID=A0ABX7JJF3_9RHOB|nr:MULTISPECIES: transglutaminase domain-containing protein [Paracoccus]QRZ14365.1 transglutaminase domain-containing protein [Paracoccus methylovorus]